MPWATLSSRKVSYLSTLRWPRACATACNDTIASARGVRLASRASPLVRQVTYLCLVPLAFIHNHVETDHFVQSHCEPSLSLMQASRSSHCNSHRRKKTAASACGVAALLRLRVTQSSCWPCHTHRPSCNQPRPTRYRTAPVTSCECDHFCSRRILGCHRVHTGLVHECRIPYRAIRAHVCVVPVVRQRTCGGRSRPLHRPCAPGSRAHCAYTHVAVSISGCRARVSDRGPMSSSHRHRASTSGRAVQPLLCHPRIQRCRTCPGTYC